RLHSYCTVHSVARLEPGDSANVDVKRPSPVEAELKGVGVNPVSNLGYDLPGKALVERVEEGLPQPQPVVKAAELPRHLDVVAAARLAECQAGVVFQRPGAAALEVGVPVDGLAQLDLTRAEQIEAVGENVLCLVKRDLPRLREELRGECGVLGDQREEARRLAL